jgi:hypothetical protein
MGDINFSGTNTASVSHWKLLFLGKGREVTRNGFEKKPKSYGVIPFCTLIPSELHLLSANQETPHVFRNQNAHYRL